MKFGTCLNSCNMTVSLCDLQEEKLSKRFQRLYKRLFVMLYWSCCQMRFNLMFVSQISNHLKPRKLLQTDHRQSGKRQRVGLMLQRWTADSGVEPGRAEKQTRWSLQWQKTRTDAVYVPPAGLEYCECVQHRIEKQNDMLIHSSVFQQSFNVQCCTRHLTTLKKHI